MRASVPTKMDKREYRRNQGSCSKREKKLIQEHAAAKEESVNAFINRAVDEAMERDRA